MHESSTQHEDEGWLNVVPEEDPPIAGKAMRTRPVEEVRCGHRPCKHIIGRLLLQQIFFNDRLESESWEYEFPDGYISNRSLIEEGSDESGTCTLWRYDKERAAEQRRKRRRFPHAPARRRLLNDPGAYASVFRVRCRDGHETEVELDLLRGKYDAIPVRDDVT